MQELNYKKDVYKHYTSNYGDKGFGMITDKQFIFTSNYLNHLLRHIEMQNIIIEKVHPTLDINKDIMYVKNNYIMIQSQKSTFSIFMPPKSNITNNQLLCLKYYFNELRESLLNKPLNDYDNTFFCREEGVYEFKNIEQSIEFINSYYCDINNENVADEFEEKIIGYTIEDIKNIAIINNEFRIQKEHDRLIYIENNKEKVYQYIDEINRVENPNKKYEYYIEMTELICEIIYHLNNLDECMNFKKECLNQMQRLPLFQNEIYDVIEDAIKEFKYEHNIHDDTNTIR